MSRLTRYAAALHHIGPRQTGLHLWHRLRRRVRRYSVYADAAGEVEWVGRALVPLLPQAGGARLRDGRFSAVGLTRDVGDPPRWDADGPLLWVFNLHYFGFLEDLPREDQVHVVLDWIHRYPPSGRRPGWMPYPLSLRLRSWIRRLFDEEWGGSHRGRVLASIEAQASCLADTMEHHLRGNHLLENALTLRLLAACLRGPLVERWQCLADRVLDRELPEQFLPDGGHLERSPMYHALLVHGLLDLVNVLGEEEPLRARLLERLPAALGYLAALRHPDGEIALFNDAAFGIAPRPSDLLEYAERLGLRAPVTSGTAVFPDSGYFVWKAGEDALIVDAGSVGPDYVLAHAHGDIFSFELSLGSQRVVVDGGTSTYEAGPERQWVRSTRAHNTVEIAGIDQCEFFGAFRVGRRGRPHDVTTRVSGSDLRVAGWHDGYRHLSGRPVHHRTLEWVHPPGALLVWDVVTSGTRQPAVSRLRFAPEAKVRALGSQEATVEIGGRELRVRSFGGGLTHEDGCYAPRFGDTRACPVLAFHKGSTPEFGYVLAHADVTTWIDKDSAHVASRRIRRDGGAAGSGRGETT